MHHFEVEIQGELEICAASQTLETKYIRKF